MDWMENITGTPHSIDVSPLLDTTLRRFFGKNMQKPLEKRGFWKQSVGQNGPGRPAGSGGASGGGLGVKPGDPNHVGSAANGYSGGLGGMSIGMPSPVQAILSQSGSSSSPSRPGTGFGNTPASKPSTTPAGSSVNAMRTTSTSKSAMWAEEMGKLSSAEHKAVKVAVGMVDPVSLATGLGSVSLSPQSNPKLIKPKHKTDMAKGYEEKAVGGRVGQPRLG